MRVETGEAMLVGVLIQLLVMIAAARLVGGLFRRLGQPAAAGEIVAGLMLGPSLFGALFPAAALGLFGAEPAPAISVLSQLGLILLMFQVGASFEFGTLGRGGNRRRLAAITAVSIAAPFAAGLVLGGLGAGSLAPGQPVLPFALFFGVALAITAVPILGRILLEFGLNRHEAGVLAIAAAALNDVIGWVLLAGVSAVAAGAFDAGAVGRQAGGIVLFLCLAWLLGRPVAGALLRRFPLRDGIIPPDLLASVLILVLAFALVTFHLGIFAIFGGFAAGILFHRDHAFAEAWSAQPGRLVLVLLLPVFFTYTGLRTNLLGLGLADLGWLALILATAILSKVLPVFAAARATGMPRDEALLLGVLMNTRALMELIVLNIGYDLGVIPQKLFTMLVIMALVTTLMTGPLLRRILPRMGHAIPAGIDA
jgi:Kef-type K+ transport system membrane component KefB